MDSPKIKVRLENNFKVITFLDTKAEINIMTRKVIEDIRLIMKKGPKL